MSINKKLKLTMLATSGLAISALPVVAINQAKSANNDSKTTFIGDDFNLVNPEGTGNKQNIFNGIYRESNITSRTTRPQYVISQKPKLVAYNEYLGINFYQTNDEKLGNGIKIAVTRFDKIQPSPKDFALPLSVREVTSAKLIDNKLWLIVGQGTEAPFNPALMVYEFINMESPARFDLKQIGDPLPLMQALPNEPGILKEVVLTPVYELIDGKVSLASNQMYVWVQNSRWANFNGQLESKERSLKRFYINPDSANVQPVYQEEFKSIGNLGVNDAAVMSLFAMTTTKNIRVAPNNFAVYYSITPSQTETRREIGFATFNNSKEIKAPTSSKILDTTINIHEIEGLQQQTMMPYPKVDFAKIVNNPSPSQNQGLQLLWFLPLKYTYGQPIGTQLYSQQLKIDDKGQFINDSNANINTINLASKALELSYIDYADYGNFSEGNNYIPVKYRKRSTITDVYVQMPGIVNWKTTLDDQFWNNANYWQTDVPSISKHLESLSATGEFAITTPNGIRALSTMTIKNVDVKNSKIDYLIYQKDLNLLDNVLLYEQTRQLTSTKDALKIGYDSSSASLIYLNINDHNIWKIPEEGDTEQFNLLMNNLKPEILKQSINVKGIDNDKPTNQAITIIEDTVKYNEVSTDNGKELESVDLEFKFTNGTFVNGGLVPMDNAESFSVRLWKQPEGGFPIHININQPTGLTVKGSEFVSKMETILPADGILPFNWQNDPKYKGFIGSKNSDLVQIDDLFLPYLEKISFENDEFSGKVKITTTFDNKFGVNQNVYTFTMGGFFAIETILFITLPITAAILIAIVLTITLLQSKKKKAQITKAFTVGMKYNEKLKQAAEVSLTDKTLSEKKPMLTASSSVGQSSPTKSSSVVRPTGPIKSPSNPGQTNNGFKQTPPQNKK